jgi:hypothetical protein
MHQAILSMLVCTFASLTQQAAANDRFQIKEIQKSLNYLAYDAGLPDGIMGPQTKHAMESFFASLGGDAIIHETTKSIDILREKMSPADIEFAQEGKTKEFVLKQSRTQTLIRYLYPVDLNSDGVEELIIAGFESQAQEHSDWSGAKIGIFEWQEGRLEIATDKWLDKEEQLFMGVGDVVSGDFNGDGLPDLFLSAYTDSHTDVNAYALYNEGDSFRRVVVDVADWQHGVTSDDINADGYADVFASGYHGSEKLYLGSADGLVMYELVGNAYTGGSGAAFGRYFSDENAQLIIVDNARGSGTADQDTNLYRITLDKLTKTARLEKVSSLPRPIFERREWNSAFLSGLRRSHDIRAKSVDFNGDGSLDVLVFSTNRRGSTSANNKFSALQFLQNLGNGIFEDVTDEKLYGFNYYANPSYSPVLRDLDGDSDVDIFVSEHDYQGEADSTDIILQDSQGRFVSVGHEKLTHAFPPSGQEDVATILRGPDNRNYIVRHTQTKRGYDAKDILKYYEVRVTPTR